MQLLYLEGIIKIFCKHSYLLFLLRATWRKKKDATTPISVRTRGYSEQPVTISEQKDRERGETANLTRQNLPRGTCKADKLTFLMCFVSSVQSLKFKNDKFWFHKLEKKKQFMDLYSNNP